MDQKLIAFEQHRQEQYDLYRKYLIIGALTAIFLVGIIFLVMAGNIKSRYDDYVKKNIIDGLIKEMYPDGEYLPNQMLNIEYIASLGIYRRPDRWSGEDYFSGTYKGVKFACSEVKLEERRESVDSKGNRRVYYVTYFYGRFYTFTFEKTFEQKLQIMEKRAGQKAPGRLVKYDTENIEFNKKFNIYANDQHYVFYQLTPVIQLNLMAFEQMHSGTIQALYHDNSLDIAVNDSTNTLNLTLKTPLQRENLKTIMQDIQMPAAMINEFNLDSDKFKNI